MALFPGSLGWLPGASGDFFELSRNGKVVFWCHSGGANPRFIGSNEDIAFAAVGELLRCRPTEERKEWLLKHNPNLTEFSIQGNFYVTKFNIETLKIIDVLPLEVNNTPQSEEIILLMKRILALTAFY